MDQKELKILLKKNLKTNYIFYIGMVLIIYFYSKKTNTGIFCNLISFILFSLFGYLVHVTSHYFNFNYLNEKLINQKTLLTNNKTIKNLMKKISNIVDFHENVHHDLSVNKTPKNLIYEFLNNFLFQGFIFYIVIIFFRNLNPKIAIIWGLIYASSHIINFNFINPITHQQHHENKFTNFGLDVWDIIFNTKFNHEIENCNHMTINLFLIFFLVTFINLKYK